MIDEWIKTSVWDRFSRKMGDKIMAPRNAGLFKQEEALARGMFLVEGRAGVASEGNGVIFYWLVDPTDGVIVDAKFQAFGQAALIAAAESGCGLVTAKNYDQAKRIGADLIDKSLRDKPDSPAFPEETMHLVNLVLEAIDAAALQCSDIPLAPAYVSPIPPTEGGGGGYPGWLLLSQPQKLAVIEQVLNEQVRPYVELDAGGIEVQELIHDRELIVAYKGSCTTCFSSIGATLSTIQQIIQTQVHPDLVVVPNMDALKL
jgi:NifU-like protein